MGLNSKSVGANLIGGERGEIRHGKWKLFKIVLRKVFENFEYDFNFKEYKPIWYCFPVYIRSLLYPLFTS